MMLNKFKIMLMLQYEHRVRFVMLSMCDDDVDVFSRDKRRLKILVMMDVGICKRGNIDTLWSTFMRKSDLRQQENMDG